LNLLLSESARVEEQVVLELNGASMGHMTQVEGFAKSMNYQWIDVWQMVHMDKSVQMETCI
jgi:hypothetical protein